MCELCENIGNPDKLIEDRRIIKCKDNTYKLELWRPSSKDEIDKEYILYKSIEITECPDCNRKLGDKIEK
jgi:hypothetical protein